jgi:vancomycin resistance protein YoaR
MRRPKLRLILGLSIPLLVVVVLLAAWAIDSSSASGKVPRNVELAGRDISKLPEDELAATVGDIADEYAKTPVQVRAGTHTYKLAAAKLGLRLDEASTVKAALDLDHDTSLPERPVVWLGSFLDERRAPLRFSVDAEVLRQGLEGLAGNASATEPKVVDTGNGFGIVSGSGGTRIDPSGVRSQLLRRASSGEKPIIVSADEVERKPSISDRSAQALADRLTAATAKGLAVVAGDRLASIPASTVRSWIGTKVAGRELAVTLDAEQATADLVGALPGVTKPADASITLVNGAVQITPSHDGERCCAADTPARLLAAVNGGTGKVTLDLEVAKPKFTTEAAQKLGIKEPVGTTTEWKGQAQVKSFTTYYAAGAPRVTNIHRIADLVRGTLVKPGETFSVNGTVGQRTEAKGFVMAPAIANGVEHDEIGGGVSQFATTMFNAAFFAGLPMVEYQSHSEHFDRYPYGREATMGWEHPDMAWKNDTPYGILIWTSYTDTSVTVTLWSTQYAYGEQTGQSSSHSGTCTSVSTTRTIHYADGHTGTDVVHARYRDPGHTTCNG